MRGLRIVAVALGLCVAAAQTARAGLYNPAEPDWQVSDRFDEFVSSTLIPLRQFGTKEGNAPMHKRAALAAQMAQATTGPLTVEQRLSLSAYLIRVPKIIREGSKEKPDYRPAVNILSPAQRDPRERDNFLIYANLATAEYLDGQFQRARDYLADALRIWPEKWSQVSEPRRQWLEKLGWNEARFNLYRRAETYLLRLIRLRSRERPAAFGRSSPLGTEVEPLFEGGKPPSPVRFVSDSGKYEAGSIAKAEKAKLPPDAVEIVEQLLIWLPHDDRLFWLLGELLNARGEYLTAGQEVFAWIGDKLKALSNDFASGTGGETSEGGNQPAALTKVRELSDRRIEEFTRLPELHKQHLEKLIARAKADKAAAVAAQAREQQPAVAPPPAPPRKPPTPPGATNGSLPIDLRSLAVGFAAGLIVMVFGLWQVREIRRRLQARSAASRANSQLAQMPGAGSQEGRPG
jgi:tetratricopeptide (TPR) repeat protein